MGLGIQTTINFDTAGNFIHDATKVQFVGGLAKLLEEPGNDFINLFSLAGTVDPPNNTVGDAIFSRGDVTVQAQVGSPVVAGGVLEMRGGLVEKRVEYDLTGVATLLPLTGCVRTRIAPRYTGSPATTQTFWRESDGTTTSTFENVIIQHLSNGNLEFILRRTDGSDIVLISGAFAAVAGQTFEIEFNWDVAGAGVRESRAFVGGTQFQATNTGSSDARVGGTVGFIGSVGPAELPDFDVVEMQRFSVVQHTANYAPTALSPIFALDPTIEVNSAPFADAIKSFGPSVQEDLGAGGIVRWIMKLDAQLKWWDGAAWVDSDGSFAQSNTIGDATANITALDLTGGKVFKPVPLLHVDAGFSPVSPTVTSITYEYDFFVAKPDLPGRSLVFGFVTLTDGTPVSGATVEVEHDGFRHGSFQVEGDKQSVVTDADGRWEISVIETASLSLSPYEFRLAGQLFKNVQIPNTPSVDFGTLTVS